MNRSSRILSVGIVPTLLASIAPAADPATAEAWPSTDEVSEDVAPLSALR